MKKKISLLFILLSLAFFLTTGPSLAQGTCKCYDGALPGECMQGPSSCDTGYSPSTCYYGPSGCTCDCVSSAGYCCNGNSDCSGGKVCLNVPGGCTTQGYFGECLSPPSSPGSNVNKPLDLKQIQTGAFPLATYGVDTTIGQIISDLLPYIFTITGILLLIYLLMGGFQLMFAAGDPKKIQGAWGKITNAVVGFVIIFIAYWLTQLFGKIFNIQIINDIFK